MTIPIEERTAKRWAQEIGAIMADQHPSFSRNRKIRGNSFEFVARSPKGLVYSLGFVCKCGYNVPPATYYLCLAIGFTDENPSLTSTLFSAGSRLNHCLHVNMQVQQHLGLHPQSVDFPPKLWSCSQWRSNTLDLVRTGIPVALDVLLPHYQSVLSQGKSNLLRLYCRTKEILPKFKGIDRSDLPSLAKAIGCSPTELEASIPGSTATSAYEVALRAAPLPSNLNSLAQDSLEIGNDMLIAAHVHGLNQEAHRLDQIIRTVEAL